MEEGFLGMASVFIYILILYMLIVMVFYKK